MPPCLVSEPKLSRWKTWKCSKEVYRVYQISLFQTKYTLNASEQYDQICKYFHLPQLNSRRKAADLNFLHKCVHSEVDSPYLVGQINYNFPTRTLRHLESFKPARSRLNVKKHSFIPRSMSFYNYLVCKYHFIDIFTNRSAFRQTVKDILYR